MSSDSLAGNNGSVANHAVEQPTDENPLSMAIIRHALRTLQWIADGFCQR